MAIKEIQKEMLSLESPERVKLIEMLWESLDKTDAVIEKEWADESESRYQAYKNGEIQAISLDDVKKKISR